MKIKRFTISIDFDVDLKFFAIMPALNLNFHGGFTLEFEWLMFGIYLKLVNSPSVIHEIF